MSVLFNQTHTRRHTDTDTHRHRHTHTDTHTPTHTHLYLKWNSHYVCICIHNYNPTKNSTSLRTKLLKFSKSENEAIFSLVCSWKIILSRFVHVEWHFLSYKLWMVIILMVPRAVFDVISLSQKVSINGSSKIVLIQKYWINWFKGLKCVPTSCIIPH